MIQSTYWAVNFTRRSPCEAKAGSLAWIPADVLNHVRIAELIPAEFGLAYRDGFLEAGSDSLAEPVDQNSANRHAQVEAVASRYLDEPVREGAIHLRNRTILRTEHIDCPLRVDEVVEWFGVLNDLNRHRGDPLTEEIERPFAGGPLNVGVPAHAFFARQPVVIVGIDAIACPHQVVDPSAGAGSENPADVTNVLRIDEHDAVAGKRQLGAMLEAFAKD
jgi:hypothetical protein